MDKTVCPYCNKKLVTPFSCRRHIELTHSGLPSTPYNFYPRKRKMANNVPYPPLDMDLIAMQKKACDLLEEGSDSDEEEEEEEEEDKEVKEDDSSDDEVDDHDPWMALLEGALGKLKEDGKMDNIDEMLHEPKFSILMEALRAEAMDLFGRSAQLENTPIQKALAQTGCKNSDKGMGDEEAMEAAWDKRKHLIKSFVRDNMTEISEVWDELD